MKSVGYLFREIVRSVRRTAVMALAVLGVGVACAADLTITYPNPAGGNNNDTSYIDVREDTTITLKTTNATSPKPFLIFTRIKVFAGAKLTFAYDGSVSSETIQFANGLVVETGANTDVTFPETTKTVALGRSSVGLTNWPVVKIGQSSFKNFLLQQYVTVRAIPAGSYTIADGAFIALQGENPLGMPSDAFTLTNYDILCLTQAAIPAGITVNVPVGRTFGFRPSQEDGWNWKATSYASAHCRVNLLGKGARVLFRNEKGATFVRSYADICGTGEIEIRTEKGGATAGAGNFQCMLNGLMYVSPLTAGASLVIPVRQSAEEVAPSDAWKSKVTHWFDASKADTLVKYDYKKDAGKRYEYLGEHDIIVGWTDAVKSPKNDLFLYNRHAMNGCRPEYLPYVVKNGLNGLSYLSFGHCANAPDGTIADAADYGSQAMERRWLRFHTTSTTGCPGNTKPNGGYSSVADKFVIMVLGSQYGGGKAILDTHKPASGNVGNLARTESTLNAVWTYYDAGFNLATDGLWVIPNSDKPNGTWQIVSLDASAAGATFDGLGSHQVATDSDQIPNNGYAGGMNYAEILFFAARPTEDERLACEQYLAKKWGLTASYSHNVAAQQRTVLTGPADSRIEFKEGSTLTVEGDYKGKFVVAEGCTLTIADKPKPPTEKDLPSANRIGWYDPNFAGALKMNEKAGYTEGIDLLYDRTLDGVLTADTDYAFGGQYSANNGHNGRYPYRAVGPRATLATTPSRTWMDFTPNGSESPITGNNLRRRTIKAGVNTTGFTALTTVREVYMALDTSLGGGSPIGSDVGFTKGILPRQGDTVSSPIWNANNTVQVTATYLDDQAVDPAKGFSGRPEIFSFTTAANLEVGLLAYYNMAGQKNYEIIGETIFYSQPLADADRQKVQEYLMYKWLGDLNGKYSDLTEMTLSGAGAVEAANAVTIPRKTENFTGTVTITGASTFDLADDPVSIAANLAFSDTATVAVTAATKPAPGMYTLATVTDGKTLTVPEAMLGKAKLTFSGALEKCQGKLHVSEDGTSLLLDIASRGTMVIVR